jgi:Carboxypeptidase regulatory-like domain
MMGLRRSLLLAALLVISSGILIGSCPEDPPSKPTAPESGGLAPDTPALPEETDDSTEGGPRDVLIEDCWDSDEPWTPWGEHVPVRVLSAVDLSPLEGVLARVTRKYSADEDEDLRLREGMTDADGRVLLPGCGGFVELMFRRVGYHVHFVEMQNFKEEQVVRLRPGTPLSGRVVLAGSGKPVAGARVSPWPAAEWWEGKIDGVLVTGEDGGFTVAAMPTDRPVVFGVAAAGYGSRTVRRRPDDDADPFVIELGHGAVIEGRVLDLDGEALAGVEIFVALAGGDQPFEDPEWATGRDLTSEQVRMLRMGLKTGKDGSFRFRGLKVPAAYVVHARDGDGRRARSVPLMTNAGGDRLACDVTIAPLAMIIPRVTAPEGMDAAVIIDDARITRGGQWGDVPDHQKADWLGEEEIWALTDLLPGEVDVYFEPRGFLPQSKRVAVKAGERVEVVFELDPGLTLTGILVDTDGNPVAGGVGFYTKIGGLSHGEHAKAGEDGRFEISALPDAPGRLWVGADGYALLDIADVRPGGDVGRIVLTRAGRIIGRLVGVENQGDADSGIRDAAGAGSSGGRRIDADGFFEFDGIAPGVATDVYLKLEGLPAFVKRGVVLKPGETVDLGEVRLPEAVAVRGVVLDEGGAPVAWAEVSIEDWWQDVSATTDARGRFEMSGVTPGPSSIVVEVAGVPRAHRTVDLTGEPAPIEIRIARQGTVLCEVRDRTGKAAPTVLFTLFSHGPDGEPDLGRHTHHWTDSAGRLLIPAVPGTYTLAPGAHEPEAVPHVRFPVTADNETKLELTLP